MEEDKKPYNSQVPRKAYFLRQSHTQRELGSESLGSLRDRDSRVAGERTLAFMESAEGQSLLAIRKEVIPDEGS
jgi:hypothetical protein